MLTSHQLNSTARNLSEASILDLEKIAIQLKMHVGATHSARIIKILMDLSDSLEDSFTNIRVRLNGPKSGTPHYITSIKALREATGIGLKEAKSAIDGDSTLVISTLSKVESLRHALDRYGVKVELA